MPTPRTSETLQGTAAELLDEGLRIIAPESGKDVSRFLVNGANYTLQIARSVGTRRDCLKGGSPSCDCEGVTGEVLRRGGAGVICVG
jgi:uncharacterized protein YbbK (DUF523 family)